MNLPSIYPGMIDKRVEFFAVDDEVFCTHNFKTLPYNQFPSHISLAVIGHMSENPHLVKFVQKKTKKDFGGDFSKRYTYYIFGGLNLTPDIDLDGTMNGCDFYNCDENVPVILSVNNGKSLTKTEVDLLKMVVRPTRVIANNLFRSYDTITTHIQNIQHKTGLASKTELTELACKQGII